MTRFVDREFSVVKQVVDRTTLNSIGDQATAFSIGVNYHSRCHTNDDMYYTLATVIALKEVSADEVIYSFIFPAYKLGFHCEQAIRFYLTSASIMCVQIQNMTAASVSHKTVLRSNPL